MPLSARSITWYWLKDSDVLRPGRWPQAWRKVMATHRWGWLNKSCKLTACTLGSAPGPALGTKYGRTLHLYIYIRCKVTWISIWFNYACTIEAVRCDVLGKGSHSFNCRLSWATTKLHMLYILSILLTHKYTPHTQLHAQRN